MKKQIGLKEVMSIGIGGMVGGGIFAVLGLAVSLAKGGTPVAFAIAGIIALLTSYSYVKLSLAFPDKSGTVKFINQGFGIGVFSGAMNNLLWLSYIIMLSLYASAFGSYAPNLLPLINPEIDFHIYTTAVVLIATFINYYSIKVVGEIESYAVFVKLLILLVFVGIGIYGLTQSSYVSQLSPEKWEKPLKLIAGGMVIFVAYEGFELIANAVPNIKNPAKNIPRAYYYSVSFVMALYIIIAIITVGSLPFDEIAKAQDYVLAEAAKPMLGKIGFSVITLAALISTFSAINATLYGGSQMSYVMAEDQELPKKFAAQFIHQPIGLVFTMILTLLVANFLPLESISTTGSVGFLMIFAVVNFIAYRLRKKINGGSIVPLIGCISCSIALLVLISQQFQSNPKSIMISFGAVLFCFILEWWYNLSLKTNKNQPS